MYYSPVRHSPPESKLSVLPFDLHVLSMPPAFNLSQDQTLQFNLCLSLFAGIERGKMNFPSFCFPSKREHRKFL